MRPLVGAAVRSAGTPGSKKPAWLAEVFRIADRLTVMRDGRVRDHLQDARGDVIVEAIIGRAPETSPLSAPG